MVEQVFGRTTLIPGIRTEYVNAEIATLPRREQPVVTTAEFKRVHALALEGEDAGGKGCTGRDVEEEWAVRVGARGCCGPGVAAGESGWNGRGYISFGSETQQERARGWRPDGEVSRCAFCHRPPGKLAAERRCVRYGDAGSGRWCK